MLYSKDNFSKLPPVPLAMNPVLTDLFIAYYTDIHVGFPNSASILDMQRLGNLFNVWFTAADCCYVLERLQNPRMHQFLALFCWAKAPSNVPKVLPQPGKEMDLFKVLLMNSMNLIRNCSQQSILPLS